MATAIDIRGAARELASRTRERRDERSAAEPRILRPEDIVGEYDAARLLHTTLDGKARPITLRDLAVFSQNARTAGKKFKGGVTAQGVINQSLAVDRQRASQQIRQAIPFRLQASTMIVVTSAGPDSEVSRHMVTLQLLNMPAAIASPKRSMELAAFVSKGPIKVACDCGRWRYWYSYLATVGNYTAGYRESGFPKIRNPRLVGLGCKHILRACTNLHAGMYRPFIIRAMDGQRRSLEEKFSVQMTPAQARDLAARRVNQVRTTEERRTAALRRAANAATGNQTARVRKIVTSVVADHEQRLRAAVASQQKAIAALERQSARMLAHLQRLKSLTPEQFAASIRALKGPKVGR